MIAPIVGAGTCGYIITVDVAVEVHPSELVTVNVYVVEAASPLKVDVVRVPVLVAPPGEAVKTQIPDAGKSLNTTLPVETEQVGWVIAPTVGAAGVDGCAFIVTVDVGVEVQPSELVTVKVCPPAANVLNVAVVPVPVIVEPDDSETVHVPVAGKLLKATLPVDVEQVG